MTDGKSIVLDSRPMRRDAGPPSDEALDEIVGMLDHEVGHIVFRSMAVSTAIQSALANVGGISYDPELFNIAEDYFVDAAMAQRNELYGKYIDKVRTSLDKPGAMQQIADAFEKGEVQGRDMTTYAVKQALGCEVYHQPMPANMPEPVKRLVEWMQKQLPGLLAHQKAADPYMDGQRWSESMQERIDTFTTLHEKLRDTVTELTGEPPDDEAPQSGGGTGQQAQNQQQNNNGGGGGGGNQNDQSDDGDDEDEDEEDEGDGEDGSSPDGGDEDPDEDGEENGEGDGDGGVGDDDSDGDEGGAPSPKKQQTPKKGNAEPKPKKPKKDDSPYPGVLPSIKSLTEHKQQAKAEVAKVVDQMDRGELEDVTEDVVELCKSAGVSPEAAKVRVNLNIGKTLPAWTYSGDQVETRVREAGSAMGRQLGQMFDEVKALNTRNYRGLDSGRISRSRLYRAGYRDDIYQRRDKGMDTGACIIVLLDNSGSIHLDGFLEVMAPIAVAASQANPNDKHEITVAAYTDRGSSVVVDVMYKKGFDSARLGVTPQGNTPSVHALAAAAGMARKSRKKTKLIIHVTDGEPNAVASLGAGTTNGLRALKRMREQIESEGVQVVTVLADARFVGQVAPYHEATLQGYRDAHGDLVPVAGLAAVPTAVQQLIRKTMLS